MAVPWYHRSRLCEVSIISWASLVLFLVHIFCALSAYSVSSARALDLVWPLWYHSTVKPCTPPSITQGTSLSALRTLCSKGYLIALVFRFYKMYVLIHFAKLHVWTLFKRVNVHSVLFYVWASYWCTSNAVQDDKLNKVNISNWCHCKPSSGIRTLIAGIHYSASQRQLLADLSSHTIVQKSCRWCWWA